MTGQDHEQALIDAIAKLTDISDGESGNYALLFSSPECVWLRIIYHCPPVIEKDALQTKTSQLHLIVITTLYFSHT